MEVWIVAHTRAHWVLRDDHQQLRWRLHSMIFTERPFAEPPQVTQQVRRGGGG